MSSPPKHKPAKWHPRRLAQAMKSRDLDEYGVRAAINQHRMATGNATPITLNTIRWWLDGSRNPMIGRQGYESGVFEIADALELSLDWLLGRVDVEPRVARKRKQEVPA